MRWWFPFLLARRARFDDSSWYLFAANDFVVAHFRCPGKSRMLRDFWPWPKIPTTSLDLPVNNNLVYNFQSKINISRKVQVASNLFLPLLFTYFDLHSTQYSIWHAEKRLCETHQWLWICFCFSFLPPQDALFRAPSYRRPSAVLGQNLARSCPPAR